MFDVDSLPFMLAFLIGLGAIVIGLAAFLYPKQGSKYFGLATDGSGLGWVRAAGMRDVFIGLMFIIVSQLGDRRVIGEGCFAVAIVGAGDFYLTRKYGSKQISWTHFVGTVGIIAVGAFAFLSGAKV